MLAILVLSIPAVIVRYLILKRPIRRIYALLAAVLILLGFMLVLDGVVGQPIISAAAAISYFTLAPGKKKKAQELRSKTDPDYVSCPDCGLAQWSGYTTCQKCGVALKTPIERAAPENQSEIQKIEASQSKVLLPSDSEVRKWAGNLADQLQEHVNAGKISDRGATDIVEAMQEARAAVASGDSNRFFLAQKKIDRMVNKKFSLRLAQRLVIIIPAIAITFSLLHPPYYFTQTLHLRVSGGSMHKASEHIAQRGHYWIWSLPNGSTERKEREIWTFEPNLDLQLLLIYVLISLSAAGAGWLLVRQMLLPTKGTHELK